MFKSAQPLEIMSVHCLFWYMLHKKRPHCEVLDEMTVAQTSSKMGLLNLSQTSDVDIATTSWARIQEGRPILSMKHSDGSFLWALGPARQHTPCFGAASISYRDCKKKIETTTEKQFYIICYRRNVVPQDFLQGIVDCCFCFLDSFFVPPRLSIAQLAVHEVPN